MSTGSSPSAFAEFADATLRLPESLREYLRWPMGALVHGPSVLPTIGAASPVVTVGDFCTLDLVARGRTPDICVVDFKTKRQEDPELREALQRIGSKVLRLTNPTATITPDAWHVISEAFKSDERVRVEVRGEEDLLALVRGGPVRNAVPGRRGRPGGRGREIQGPRRLAAHGTIADATRSPAEEG